MTEQNVHINKSRGSGSVCIYLCAEHDLIAWRILFERNCQTLSHKGTFEYDFENVYLFRFWISDCIKERGIIYRISLYELNCMIMYVMEWNVSSSFCGVYQSMGKHLITFEINKRFVFLHSLKILCGWCKTSKGKAIYSYYPLWMTKTTVFEE